MQSFSLSTGSSSALSDRPQRGYFRLRRQKFRHIILLGEYSDDSLTISRGDSPVTVVQLRYKPEPVCQHEHFIIHRPVQATGTKTWTLESSYQGLCSLQLDQQSKQVLSDWSLCPLVIDMRRTNGKHVVLVYHYTLQ